MPWVLTIWVQSPDWIFNLQKLEDLIEGPDMLGNQFIINLFLQLQVQHLYKMFTRR